MSEEEIEKTGETQSETVKALTAKIGEMQKTMVSKEDYDKVIQENKDLVASIQNGAIIDDGEKEIEPESLQDLSKRMNNPKSNRDFWDAAVKERKLLIAEGRDTSKVNNVSQDYTDEQWEAVEKLLQENPDPLEFNLRIQQARR